jgi:hypothetical protein
MCECNRLREAIQSITEEDILEESEFTDNDMIQMFCEQFNLNYAKGKIIELIAVGNEEDLEEASLLLQRECQLND